MSEDFAGAFGCIGVFCLIFVVLLLALGGVWRTEVTFAPAAVAGSANSVPFEETLTARHYLDGLIQGAQPDLKQALAKYVRSGEQVTELTITTKHTFTDCLVTGVTLGIYAPITVTIRGTVGQAGGAPAR
jgi:hypothetical protein